jgi:phospholipid/cholesterol/gamma-HCH transport system substrate-binding protein
MFEADPRRRLRVGLFMAALIALLAVVILLLGGQQGLFVEKVTYHARFIDVVGLTAGAPVWLNGVVVGQVDSINLPSDPAKREITVNFSVEERVDRRIRQDSVVRIRTLGLLGDRYLDVSSGSPSAPRLEPGSDVPSQEPQDIAQVLQKGGDVVSNVVAITASLRTILDRVERGEGVIGELTVSPTSGRRVVDQLSSVLEQTDLLLKDVRQGRGVLGKLIADPQVEKLLIDDLSGFVHAGREVAEALDRDLKNDDSLLAGVLRDPKGRERLQRMLDDMGLAATAVAEAGNELAHGEGTLGRLMADQKFAGEFLDNLNGLTASLRSVAEKLNSDKGTAGRLLNDPSVYQDLEDVLRGVRRSKLLSWLIRNRREAGEEARQKSAREGGGR